VLLTSVGVIDILSLWAVLANAAKDEISSRVASFVSRIVFAPVMAVPGKTPTSPYSRLDDTPAKVTAVRAWTANFPQTCFLNTVVGASDVEGALLGAELGGDEVDGLELGMELGALDVEGRNEVDGLELGTELGAGILQVRLTVPPLSKVTADWAMAQPCKTDPVPSVMAVPAIMEPSTTLLAPRVAAVPRTQTMSSALAPLVRRIWVFAAVTKVVPAMNVKVPDPLKVTFLP
jgi:hypothetical protein